MRVCRGSENRSPKTKFESQLKRHRSLEALLRASEYLKTERSPLYSIRQLPPTGNSVIQFNPMLPFAVKSAKVCRENSLSLLWRAHLTAYHPAVNYPDSIWGLKRSIWLHVLFSINSFMRRTSRLSWRPLWTPRAEDEPELPEGVLGLERRDLNTANTIMVRLRITILWLITKSCWCILRPTFLSKI